MKTLQPVKLKEMDIIIDRIENTLSKLTEDFSDYNNSYIISYVWTYLNLITLTVMSKKK